MLNIFYYLLNYLVNPNIAGVKENLEAQTIVFLMFRNQYSYEIC
jgi:hypothetical protein